MATAAAIGLLFYFLGETKQRRAFLEAKQSLDVKMVIEEQSAEQVTGNIYIYFLHQIRMQERMKVENVRTKVKQNE